MNLKLNSFILVQKPYMDRRTFATFRKQWPEAECIVTSPQLSYEDYGNGLVIYNVLENIQSKASN